jgi:predicted GNAT family N-acyltransferase
MDERPDVEKLKLLARDQIARLKVMQRDVVDELKNANGGGKGVAALVGVEATLGEYDYEVDRDRKMEAAPDLMAFLDALMCSPAYEKEMERLRAFVVDVEEQLAETARRLQSATTAVPEREEAEQPDVVEWLMEQGCTAAEVVAFTDGAGVDEVGKLLLFEPTDTAVLLRLGIGDATFGRVIAAAAVRALALSNSFLAKALELEARLESTAKASEVQELTAKLKAMEQVRKNTGFTVTARISVVVFVLLSTR